MISLQFITHHTEKYSYLDSARMALEGGCKWIQLRMKEAPLEEVEAVALQLKPMCKEHGRPRGIGPKAGSGRRTFG